MKIEVEVVDITDKKLNVIEYEDIRYNLSVAKPEARYKKKLGKKIFDETYKAYVSESDINKVKKAILHTGLDYQPTTKNISNQTGLTSVAYTFT